VEQPKFLNPLHQHETGQPDPTPKVNTWPLACMFQVVSVVEQTMTKFSDVESKQGKILAVSKIILNLIQQNGH
jgi:hypothetical protein